MEEVLACLEEKLEMWALDQSRGKPLEVVTVQYLVHLGTQRFKLPILVDPWASLTCWLLVLQTLRGLLCNQKHYKGPESDAESEG